VRKALVLVVALASLWAAPGALGAGWCGSGEQVEDRPAVGTGPQVRVVYAIPSDAPDNFAATANVAADDAAAIDAWWQGQDPARTLRFDLTDFAGCIGLDIAFLRLSETGAAIADAANPFGRIVAGLTSAGLRSQFGRYVVYYDGPVSSARVCGTGGELSGGAGAAVVFMQACPNVPSTWTAAHELLHSLGAVPTGAPHECPGPNAGHVCDIRSDIMYAFATAGAEFTSALLDPGRDDYYGTGRSGDVRASPFLRRLDSQLVPVSVAFSGIGRVTSNAPGIDCTAACTTSGRAAPMSGSSRPGRGRAALSAGPAPAAAATTAA